MPLYGAAVVPFEDTFITVGGMNDLANDVYTDKVWHLKSDMTWEELQHLRLSEAKWGATALLASSNKLK